MPFRLRGYHPLRQAIQDPSTMTQIYHSSPTRQDEQNAPTTPTTQRLPSITRHRFSLIRFRSPLLTESQLFSLPAGTEMFHFPAFPPHTLYIQMRVTGHNSSRVSPFGHPRITARLPTPRGLSQAPTSFIGSWCQGIHRMPLQTCHTIQHSATTHPTPTSNPTHKTNPMNRTTRQIRSMPQKTRCSRPLYSSQATTRTPAPTPHTHPHPPTQQEKQSMEGPARTRDNNHQPPPPGATRACSLRTQQRATNP